MAEKIIDLPVRGMACPACASDVERNLNKMKGIKTANVNFANGKASVAFDTQALCIQDIVASIRGAGYEVHTATCILSLEESICANCAMNIARSLQRNVPYAVNISINISAARAAIEFVPHFPVG